MQSRSCRQATMNTNHWYLAKARLPAGGGRRVGNEGYSVLERGEGNDRGPVIYRAEAANKPAPCLLRASRS